MHWGPGFYYWQVLTAFIWLMFCLAASCAPSIVYRTKNEVPFLDWAPGICPKTFFPTSRQSQARLQLWNLAQGDMAIEQIKSPFKSEFKKVCFICIYGQLLSKGTSESSFMFSLNALKRLFAVELFLFECLACFKSDAISMSAKNTKFWHALIPALAWVLIPSAESSVASLKFCVPCLTLIETQGYQWGPVWELLLRFLVNYSVSQLTVT